MTELAFAPVRRTILVNEDLEPVSLGGGGGTEGGLTDEELRASPLAVEGPLTNTELRAAAVPVAQRAVSTVIGTVSASSGTTSTAAIDGRLVAIKFPSAYTGSPTATVQGSTDGTNFFNVVDIIGGTVTDRTYTNAQLVALAGKTLPVPLGDWLGYSHIRITLSVAQTTARDFVYSLAG